MGGGSLMPITSRVMGLQRLKHQLTGGSHKTVTVETIASTGGASPFRPGTVDFFSSVLIEPPPLIRLVKDEDIAEIGRNISLGDYVFTIVGDSISEDLLKSATQLVLNKGQADEERLQIIQVRPATINDNSNTNRGFFIVQGEVIAWSVFARATGIGI